MSIVSSFQNKDKTNTGSPLSRKYPNNEYGLQSAFKEIYTVQLSEFVNRNKNRFYNNPHIAGMEIDMFIFKLHDDLLNQIWEISRDFNTSEQKAKDILNQVTTDVRLDLYRD